MIVPPKGYNPWGIPRSREPGKQPTTLAAMRLALELAAARAAGRSRAWPAAAAARRFRGSCSATIDPRAIAGSPARLPLGTAIVSATNGKTTTASIAAGDPLARAPGSRTTRRARTSSRASPRRCSTRAEPSSACSRSTRAPCPRSRGACARGRSASATSSATSSTATASSSSSPSAGGRRSLRCRTTRRSSSTRDDPQLGELAPRRARERRRSASTTRAQARPSLQHAADSKYCVRCGTPYDYAAAYVGHLGDYRCPRVRPSPPSARRRRAGGRAARARRAAFDLVTPEGAAARPARPARPLQRLQRARGRRRWPALSAPSLDEIVGGPGRFPAAFGRFERIAVGDRRLLLLLIKNPGRRERGRADARRRRRAASWP